MKSNVLNTYVIINNEKYLETFKNLDAWKQTSDFILTGGTSDLKEALFEIEEHHNDLFFIDADMKPINGINLIRLLRAGRPDSIYVLLTESHQTFKNDLMHQAMRLGVFDTLSMPVNSKELLELFKHIVEDNFTETLYNTPDIYAFIKKRQHLRTLFYNYYDSIKLQSETDEGTRLLIQTSYNGTIHLLYNRLPYLKNFLNPDRSYTFEKLWKQYPILNENSPYVNRMIGFFDFILLLHPESQYEQMQKLYDYVLANIDHDITLATTASFLYSSPSSTSRLFLENSGQHFTQYLTKIKMLRAEYLLLNSDLYVYEISSVLGYRDQEYFSTVFRKYYHTSPSKFRADYETAKESEAVF